MKKKYTVENLALRIARDNEKFAKARPATKRVIIAKDCLSRIRFGQITPMPGTFCEIEYYNVKKENENYLDSSIKDVLNTTPNDVVVCEGCAKGSLLMSYLGRVNEFTFRNLANASNNNEYDESHEKLLQLFSKEQLTLIEAFFEGCQHIFEDEISLDEEAIKAYRNEVFNRPKSKLLSDCPEWATDESYTYSSYDFDNDVEGKILMVEICNNIIANKGTFVLPSTQL